MADRTLLLLAWALIITAAIVLPIGGFALVFIYGGEALRPLFGF